MGAREVVVIPNGVDVNKFKPTTYNLQPTNQTILITTSRLVEKNAVGDIIEALKYLPENVSLKILGIGPLEIDCKLKIKNWKLEDRVEMLGHVDYDEIPKHLHEADIFVRPSISEGFGNSFIEAMAAGLPVIATPVGGIPDFLENGSTGLFCEPRNPKSIADQIKRLMADEPLREGLIENAKRMVEDKYDWNLIAREMQSKVFNIE
jgi:glycosyltransferase involved in cell wall biosynthesis